MLSKKIIFVRRRMIKMYEIEQLKENSDNKQFYMDAVKESGLFIEWASDELKNDKELVMEAVKQNPGALEFASTQLKANKQVVRRSLKNSRLGYMLCK